MSSRAILSLRRFSVSRRQFHVSKIVQKRIIEVVPPLGESITEGSISKWTKEVGDSVAIDDVIVIVETDKVTVDIKSPHAGILSKQLADDLVSCCYHL